MERDVEMACNGITLQTPGGAKHCIPIYYEEVKWPPVGPDPERVFYDIRILAIINQGIARLSDRRVRETLSQAVQGAARSMSLPQGLELGDSLFKGERAMEAAE